MPAGETCEGCIHWRGRGGKQSFSFCHWALDNPPYCRVTTDPRCRGLKPGEACPLKDTGEEVENMNRKMDVIKAKALYDAGKNDHEIAEATGVSRSAVKAWRARNGLGSAVPCTRTRTGEAAKGAKRPERVSPLAKLTEPVGSHGAECRLPPRIPAAASPPAERQKNAEEPPAMPPIGPSGTYEYVIRVRIENAEELDAVTEKAAQLVVLLREAQDIITALKLPPKP